MAAAAAAAAAAKDDGSARSLGAASPVWASTSAYTRTAPRGIDKMSCWVSLVKLVTGASVHGRLATQRELAVAASMTLQACSSEHI